MYRGILQLKTNTSILQKNKSFSNKTCYGLTALFLKTKTYFVNKQINKIYIYIYAAMIRKIFLSKFWFSWSTLKDPTTSLRIIRKTTYLLSHFHDYRKFHHSFLSCFYHYILLSHLSKKFICWGNLRILISLKQHTFNIKYYLHKKYLHKRFKSFWIIFKKRKYSIKQLR